MKHLTKRSLAWLTSLMLFVSIFASVIVLPTQAATVDYVKSGNYIYNWGTREEVATFLSPNAEAFYKKNNTSYEELSALSGSSSTGSVPSSALYRELKDLMSSNHQEITSYNDTRSLYQYTDCEGSGKTSKKISSFYSGTPIGPAWDGGSTWNREHTWPNSKGAGGNDENDIMMLRPTSKSENSARGNKAYGEGGSYYHPNSESGGKHDLRGDVSRIMLYQYVRWGNTSKMWGTGGVMESVTILLKWVTEDPVDTWELGRNDSVESITGTRNVFVDYPELIFILFGADIPADYDSPSGEGASGSYTITATANNTAYGTVSVNGKNIIASPKTGYVVTGYTILSGSAAVVRSGNTFTVTPDSDVKIRIDFAPRTQVTLSLMDGADLLETLTAYSGDSVTLPDYSGNRLFPDDAIHSFVGWVESTVDKTTDMPTFYSVGSQYTVGEDTVLYALFSRTELDGDVLSNVFEPYSGALTEGDYLLMGTDAVMIGALTDKTRLQFAEVTLTNGNIIAPAANAVWHIAPNGTDWTVLNLGTGTYAAGTGYKSSNQATLIATLTDFAKWTVTEKSTGYDFVNVGNEAAGVNPLLRHNGSVGFACYAKNTNVGSAIKLYKRAGGTTYYFTGNAPAPCQHTYESQIAMDPTCGRGGEVMYTCTLCGDRYVEPIPATGEHTYDDEYDAYCNGCDAWREVPDKPAHTPGDINGDGDVNNRDLALLQKYLNNWDVVVVEVALDLNGDGDVSNRDLALLQKYLNNWDVELH